MPRDDDEQYALRIVLDPTTYRLLARMAELEAEERQRGVPGANGRTAEEMAAEWVRQAFRTIMPQSYPEGDPDDDELVTLGVDLSLDPTSEN